MRGLFGAPLVREAGGSAEPLDPALAAALDGLLVRPWIPPSEGLGFLEGAASLVRWELDPAGAVRYGRDLTEAQPALDASRSRHEMLGALASAGRRLQWLHACGLVHGELRPEALRVTDEGEVLLLVPARVGAAGAVLRKRLAAGLAEPTSVAFEAPEGVAGFEVSAASDVYGLAALAHFAMAGYAPLGQLHFPRAPGALGALSEVVRYGLAASPQQRPPLAALVDALAHAALALQSEPTLGAPYHTPAPPSSAAEAESTRAQAQESSAVLTLVLLVGGFFAFVGAVMLVVAGWDTVGDAGRVLLLGVLSGLCFGAGSLAARKDLPTGAVALRGFGALFGVVAGAYGFYLLGEVGRLGFLFLLQVGCLLGGERARGSGSSQAGSTLLTLASQLSWAVGAQALALYHPESSLRAWVLLSGAVTALTYAMALGYRSSSLGLFAALDAAVFASLLGEHLSTGSLTGPAIYALLVGLGYAALAAGAQLRGVSAVRSQFATFALLLGWLSAGIGLDRFERAEPSLRLFGAVWPYAVTALFGLAALLPGGNGAWGRVGGFVLLALVPTAHALLRPEGPWFLAAAGVGFALALLSFVRKRYAEKEGTQTLLLLAGMGGMYTAPGLEFLRELERGHFVAPVSSQAWLLLGLLSLSSFALLGLAGFVSAQGGRRSAWRMLEGGALATSLGALLLLSLQPGYPVGFAVAGLACSAVAALYGRAARRVVPFALGLMGLVVGAWIQYFVRLSDALPLSVRLVGFGVGLLVGGVLYEQRFKRELPSLREWS